LEKAVAIRLNTYLSSNNILSSSQHGFRANHNTITASIHCLHFIYKALDAHDHAPAVFLDVAKAFDSIDHSILLSKLEHYGIRGVALSWFKNYLASRLQYIHINSSSSNLAPVSTGVPQGSILGPILFLIYINDLPNSCGNNKFNFILYADDTTIIFQHHNLNELFELTNSELLHIDNWFKDNTLALNYNKTMYTVYSHRTINSLNDFDIYLSHNKINRTDNAKYLGLVIDNRLNWKTHITQLSKKLAHDVAMLRFASKCVPKSCILALYHAFFSSHLCYGIELWSAGGVT
jgi:hypothetical protein